MTKNLINLDLIEIIIIINNKEIYSHKCYSGFFLF